ncbi:maleylpyruvate isomerase N-terminal domain-containing protein [Mucilaginibacter sp. PAMB04168]|uniref:maleylpyruvate isomerase N-terminal domain-containing protein n=1 Tax=Mucilaginibacter sp. PAMB04168 TaxID=3138567 RepID=UPI0031F6C0B5
MSQVIPIKTLHLFEKLDSLLIDLLKSLSADDWDMPTVSPQWTVKDIAAHLLDGNMRGLSISRDGYRGDPPGEINSYRDLVTYLNDLNTIWVLAWKRISPAILIDHLQSTGREYVAYLHTLDPFAPAIFPVVWAGETESKNWFHIAREYTEKWHHQQQIREAIGLPHPLMTRELFYPCIDTLLRALPYAYRDNDAEVGTLIKIEITGDAGGIWFIEKTMGGWRFVKNLAKAEPAAAATFSPESAWKLFTKAIKAQDAQGEINQEGNIDLLKPVMSMLSIMA